MRSLLTLPCLLLSACATTAWTPPPATVPEHFRAGAVEAMPATDIDTTWWTVFNDPALDALIAAAEWGNLDLAAAERRIAQARAGLDASHGARLPGLDASASTGRSEGDDRWRAQGALRASYTLDLWGADRARVEASRARLDSAFAAHDLAAWRLATAVAQLHFQRRALDERLALAADSLRLAEGTFTRLRARYDAGLISGLDLALAENAVLAERGALLAIHQARDQAVNAAAILLGVPPAAVAATPGSVTAADAPQRPEAQPHSSGGSLLDINAPPRPDAVPGSVLLRRPDIRIQEAGLRAAHADIDIARAQLLPQLSISAGTAISRGGGGWIADIGAGLAQHIFDGGQRRAGIDQAEARYEELLYAYQGAILAAIVEVEDALLLAGHLERREALDRQLLDSAARAFSLSEARYRAGLVDALTLLSAQNSFLRARDSLLQTRSARLQALAGLYAAVAGRPVEADG